MRHAVTPVQINVNTQINWQLIGCILLLQKDRSFLWKSRVLLHVEWKKQRH